MMKNKYHCTDEKWLKTAKGDPRGFIDSGPLKELWFHTGTACNLSCPDCFEHSCPGDDRLGLMTFDEVKPFIDEAVALGVKQFSFTGGEPFVVKDIVRILGYALIFRPCLVLTNGTLPARFLELFPLAKHPNKLSFRISLDFPDPEKHDAQRGEGLFALALNSLGKLHGAGFHVSVARRAEEGEETGTVDAAYRPFLESVGAPLDTPIIHFPNLEKKDTPEITETCMTTYHTDETRAQFMCTFSRMVVKQAGEMRVYACTLVDDDPQYDLGGSLAEVSDVRVMLGHPRCFACFSGGTSCSEL